MSQSIPGRPSPKPRRGEIYWVDVPKSQSQGHEFRNTEDGNPHAYVVVSRDSVNERLHSFVGVPFSSSIQKANSTYRPLIPEREIIVESGVGMVDSVALCDHIREVALERIKGRVGKVTSFALGLIENATLYLLDGSP